MTCENYFHQNGIETFGLASVLVKVGGIQLLFRLQRKFSVPNIGLLASAAPPALMQEAASIRPMDAMPPPSSLPCRLMLLHLSVIGRVPDLPPRGHANRWEWWAGRGRSSVRV